jgi:hypothetical protein
MVDDLVGIGNLEVYLGSLSEARGHCEEALEIARRRGNRTGIVESLFFLGWATHFGLL